MPKLEVIRFHFSTPLHISNERSDYGKGTMMVHSDTLTAAIYFAWNRLGHSEWIDDDANNTNGLSVSSLFPFTTINNKFIYFLPRPFVPTVPGNNYEADTILRKQLKKISWIDWKTFQSLTEGKSTAPKAENLLGKFQSVENINPKVTDKISNKFLVSQVVPRTAISRTGKEDTTIFYIERFYFKPHAGLYMLAGFNNDDERKKLLFAPRLLGEEGIGTDRNIGHGKFTIETGDEFEIPELKDATHGINLGLYCPSDNDELQQMLNDEHTGYDFIQRGGWLSEPYNNWRKRSIYMFKEGSCFKLPPQQKPVDRLLVYGKTHDVKPLEVHPAISHNVWRSGKSIFYPIKIN